MLQPAIMEVDVHGCTVEEAIKKIEAILGTAGRSVYKIRVIHGFHGGTRIKEGIQRELGFGLEPRILRIEPGSNLGITELILRD